MKRTSRKSAPKQLVVAAETLPKRKAKHASKSVGEVEGEAAMPRLDRPRRANGGAVFNPMQGLNNLMSSVGNLSPGRMMAKGFK